MARINIRLDDGLLARIKAAVPEGQMSAWLVGLVELALDGPKEEDMVTSRMLKRLDALEDFEQFIRGRIAKAEYPLRQEKPFEELRVDRDNA